MSYNDQVYGNEYYDTHEHYHNNNWSTGTIIVIVIVVLIILALLFYFFFFRNRSSSSTPTWTYVTGSNQTTDTFTASNNSIYKSTSSGALTLSIGTANVDQTGQQFIIDNSSGGGDITIANSVTVNDSNVIQQGKAVMFVWKTTTSVIRLQ